MAKQPDRSATDRHEEGESMPPLIPRAAQIPIAGLLVFIIGWAFWRILEYVAAHPEAKPEDLRLHEILLLSVILLIVVLLPWRRLGLTVTKIGWLEFERVVTEQKKESVDAIVALEDRIVGLESRLHLHARTAAGGVQTGATNAELRDLLLAFLRKYDRWYFNVSRIQGWGSKQSGFERLAAVPRLLVNQELQRLLSVGIIRHKVGASGSTLYKA